jgi:hypothetical protein
VECNGINAYVTAGTSEKTMNMSVTHCIRVRRLHIQPLFGTPKYLHSLLDGCVFSTDQRYLFQQCCRFVEETIAPTAGSTVSGGPE